MGVAHINYEKMDTPLGHTGKIRILAIGYLIVLLILITAYHIGSNALFNGLWWPSSKNFNPVFVHGGVAVTDYMSEDEILRRFFSINAVPDTATVEFLSDKINYSKFAPVTIGWFYWTQGLSQLLFCVSATFALLMNWTVPAAISCFSVLVYMLCEMHHVLMGVYCI